MPFQYHTELLKYPGLIPKTTACMCRNAFNKGFTAAWNKEPLNTDYYKNFKNAAKYQRDGYRAGRYAREMRGL